MTNVGKIENTETKKFVIELDRVDLLYGIQAINWAVAKLLPQRMLDDNETSDQCASLVVISNHLSKHLETIVDERNGF
jgi:hypothetical protein